MAQGGRAAARSRPSRGGRSASRSATTTASRPPCRRTAARRAIAAHALSHRMLRIFEAARARAGEEAVDALFTAWGRRFFVRGSRARRRRCSPTCLAACGLDADLIDAADDEKWDAPIVEAMEVAYAFGGPKTQTPTIVVRDRPAARLQGPGDGARADRRGRARALGRHPGALAGARLLRDHPAPCQPAAPTRALASRGLALSRRRLSASGARVRQSPAEDAVAAWRRAGGRGLRISPRRTGRDCATAAMRTPPARGPTPARGEKRTPRRPRGCPARPGVRPRPARTVVPIAATRARGLRRSASSDAGSTASVTARRGAGELVVGLADAL